MNSLYKMCKSIDLKIDKLYKKVESLESKLDNLETKAVSTTDSINHLQNRICLLKQKKNERLLILLPCQQLKNLVQLL